MAEFGCSRTWKFTS